MAISFRALLIYAHLLACTAAVGTVILSDIKVVRSLLAYLKSPGSNETLPDLTEVKRTVFVSLGLLWITGLLVTGLDLSGDASVTSKLAAKWLAVGLLTLNGVMLNLGVFGVYEACGNWRDLIAHQAFLRVMVLGGLSSYLWLVTVFVGVTKELKQASSAWLILSLLAGLAVAALVAWLSARFVRTQNPLGAI